jgi:hypothetical protein
VWIKVCNVHFWLSMLEITVEPESFLEFWKMNRRQSLFYSVFLSVSSHLKISASNPLASACKPCRE